MTAVTVRVRTYVRAVPGRSAKPPRHGSPLADRVRLSQHAVERFRRRAPELAGDEPRARLAELIEREGSVLSRPPSWFQGGLPPGGFLIGVQGRYGRHRAPISHTPGSWSSLPPDRICRTRLGVPVS